ncbi:hypothetical protein AABB24_013745 [Solanum stoloniferum]|uniref:TF-B3 domain-containing protein n=1 Tax=Solanum stoloniferum TaxID=62892 RepID=A0ABD2TW27_9SOLN
MKIPSKKPHFFKPILPGFKNGINIPIGFLKYLKGYEHIKRAVLKRGGKKWRIKLNEHRFEEGNWGKFVEENDLQLGDLLVFRHEGNMEFEVSVFDSSHCDREYAEYLQEEGGGRARTVEEISKKFEFKEKSKHNIMSSHEAFRNIEAAKDIPLSHPHFVCTMKSYYLSKCSLRVPVSFARLNGLKNRTCTITIRDKHRSWTFKLYARGVNTTIVGGWHKFCVVNCLKEGDYLMFEILDNGEKPILKFHGKFLI